MQAPKAFLGEKIWNEAAYAAMQNERTNSNIAVSYRLKVLRFLKSGNSQTAFAQRLGISEKRWNNLEREFPLSKEVAFMIVGKFPEITTDWLWFGKVETLSTRTQKELEDAERAFAGAEKAKTTGGRAAG